MANIEKNLEDNVKNISGYSFVSINFYDEYINTVSPEIATELSISYIDENEYFNTKSIKLPKKQFVDVSWIMNKLNTDKVYINFSQKFAKILQKKGYKGLNVYPTTYGIGIFRLYNSKSDIQKNDIENELNNLGVKYSTEFSEAGWVFRYKISKSKENIDKINKLII